MDYEKEYKEALERAKNINDKWSWAPKLIAEYIFPEMVIDKDEYIRKDLLQFVKNWLEGKDPKYTTNEEECHNIINFLEKQAKNQIFKEEDKERLNKIADYLRYKGFEDDSDWIKSFIK